MGRQGFKQCQKSRREANWSWRIGSRTSLIVPALLLLICRTGFETIVVDADPPVPVTGYHFTNSANGSAEHSRDTENREMTRLEFGERPLSR